jgi:parallel beta-helix repeat protein
MAPLGNRGNGISMDGGEHNIIQGNRIAFNEEAGVKVGVSPHNTIRRNEIHSNTGKGIMLAAGGNVGLAAPVIYSATAGNVVGNACPGCTVEVFSDADDEGRIYEGTTLADPTGHWQLVTVHLLSGPNITATATDPDGNTSEFSLPHRLMLGRLYLSVTFNGG